MKIIEKEGKSTSEIIANFMQEYKMDLDNFKFEVIKKGSPGFLHLFGSTPTKIRFLIPDVQEQLKNYTETLLSMMNVSSSNIDITYKDKAYFVDITGVDNAGFIIGKEAKLLDSIQHLLNQMINKQEKKQLRVKVDVDKYRERRKTALLGKVKNAAEKVKKRGKSITMEPLHAANRRIVHQFIERDKKVRTMTIGEGEFKRVVIFPASQNKPNPDIPKPENQQRTKQTKSNKK